MKISRKNKITLPAYTLVELIVVMILITVVVTILASAFFNVHGFHKRLQGRIKEVSTLKELSYLLHRDYNRMKYYHADQSQLIFTNGADTIHYWFDSVVVRQQLVRMDTFSLASAMITSDSTLSITLQLGERSVKMKLPETDFGLLSYRAAQKRPEQSTKKGTSP